MHITIPEAPIHLPQWGEDFMRPARRKSARGGRASTKSQTFAQLSLIRMMGINPNYEAEPVRIASSRDFESNIKESVKVAIEGFIRKWNVGYDFDVQAFQINHRNGSHMFFPGVSRKVESFLSVEDVNIFWAEQGEFLQDEMYTVEPSIRAPGSELWFSWNPLERTGYCWREFVEHPQPEDLNIHLTYADNPWWVPHCEACWTEFDWEMRGEVCDKCGGSITLGLWELEELRRRTLLNEPELYPWIWLGEPDDKNANKVLTHDMVQKCVEAYRLGLAPTKKSSLLVPVDAGLDIAEGGRDKCCQVVRRGPIIEYVDTFPGVSGDLSHAARRAHEGALEAGYEIRMQYYDDSSPIYREFVRLNVNYRARGIGFGKEVGGKDDQYERGHTNGEAFSRRNIQMATGLRLRAMNTLRLMRGETGINPEYCLFINPNIPNLEFYLNMLSQPIRRAGAVNAKWELDKRGGDADAQSPDEFDATCLAFGYDTDGKGLNARRQ